MDLIQLRADISEEIGLDAYSRYDRERYAIPESVLRMLVEACLIEFLKGFFDFESLGHGVRARLDDFLKRFRDRQNLVTLDLSATIDKALCSAKAPDAPSRAVARKRLTELLITYGMHPEIAESHAGAIEKRILAVMTK